MGAHDVSLSPVDPMPQRTPRARCRTTIVCPAANAVFLPGKYPRQRGDHDVGAVDGALRLREQPRRRAPADARRGDRAIDLAHGDPRSMMRFVASATAGWRCEALREIAAHDRERADQLAAVVR